MEDTKQKGLIAYFANNPVAANLLMVFIIIMGVVSFLFIQRQMFPNIEVNYIDVRATYPGASPQEIEESILVKVEESIKDVTGIKKTVSTASRGSAYVSIEVDVNADIKRVLDDVNQRIDTLSNLPAGMEPINVYQVEWRQDVIEMGLVGDRPLEELKPIAKQVEDELLQLKNVMLVYLSAPEEEIAIEVDPLVLRKYDLTLSDISSAISRYSANFSAGEVKTNSGMIAVRIENQYYRGDEFRNIPVKLGAMVRRFYCKISPRSKMALRKKSATLSTQGKMRSTCLLKRLVIRTLSLLPSLFVIISKQKIRHCRRTLSSKS